MFPTIIRKFCIAVGLTLVVATAQAGFHLEPYAGYGVGNFELSSDIGTIESDVNGIVAGLRIGYARAGFFVGPDISFQPSTDFSPNINNPTIGTASSSSGDGVAGNIFLTAGFKFPVLPLRVYAGYGLYHTYSLDFPGGSDTDFEGNGGVKLGVGYKPGILFIRLPISLNLEYMTNKFKSASGLGTLGGSDKDFPFTTGTSPNVVTFTDAKSDSIMFTISAPFQFGG